ncbi:MAG: type I-E CRISPR-associated protein Cas5/CasD [Betaproteobacteria bacterium]|nr:type I-E CRISPR-associated protein Cas5/CasD [Betaproteobacteria bacterium]HMV21662.1 type I-E CRISPR-associated protein Cas5/CasD [Rhodocyclaceae bacterium]HNE15098.1 type I-E CRISPR-associated protein Cas5/CasD [Rhodocyclaceae bacterium]HNM81468.1 type I-E CRISPR-associated protein Cas5/CasD [Rhodocyclaceae bacterium]
MAFLVFQLQAPLASWGEPAVGEYRGSCGYPGESALIGLLGAALGLRREDEAAHVALQQGYGFAVGVQSTGKLLRDYHTAQVPGRTSLKGRPHATRRDELRIPKDELNTILSTRDYRQDSACLVAVQPGEEAPYALEALAEALKKPRFVLYLGRKSCPPAVPLYPLVIEAQSAFEAINAYREQLGRLCNEEIGRVVQLAWSKSVDAGLQADLSTPRKDRLIRRAAWQFGDRTEHVALLESE